MVPDPFDHWEEIYERRRTGEAMREEEGFVRSRTETSQWTSWIVEPWRSVDGEIVGIIVFAAKVMAKVEPATCAAPNMYVVLEVILTTVIAVLGADMGNVQLLDPRRKVLPIAAQQGFGQHFLDFSREVSAERVTTCGRALRLRETVIIEDIELDASFAPFRAAVSCDLAGPPDRRRDTAPPICGPSAGKRLRLG